MSHPLADLLGPPIGHVIPGGCDDCTAEQTVRRDPRHPDIWRLLITHDDTCPTYREMRQ